MDVPAMASGQDQHSVVSSTPKNNKRNNRNRIQSAQHNLQSDGTMSDTVTNPIATPKSKKSSKSTKGAVAATIPVKNGAMTSKSGTKPRPISFGGGMRPTTPSKEQAYAGPTFQASPAPSSLPVPKFFSPSGSRTVSHKHLPDDSLVNANGSNSDQASDFPMASPEPPVRGLQQSPLDVFFKADQAEKERRRTSSTLPPELPFRRISSAHETYTLPNSVNARDVRQDLHMKEGKEDKVRQDTVFSPPPQRDLDNLPSQPAPDPADDQAVRDAYTKSLKDLLFNVTDSAPPAPASPASHAVQPKAQAHQRTSEHATRPEQAFVPQPQVQSAADRQTSNYSLHYGDRNLSSLFKAAQVDGAQPAGNHRHQAIGDRPGSGADLAAPFHLQQPIHDPTDASAVSRRYLDQTIQDFQANNPPLSSSESGMHYSGMLQSSHKPLRNDVKHNHVLGSSALPRTGGAPDVKAIESDLRRALNMNIFKE